MIRKIASRYETLTTDGPQGLPEAIYWREFNDKQPYTISDWIKHSRMVGIVR